jgi:hypothetical protein
MADENGALPSVVEFSSDVSMQEAPPALPARTYPATCTAASIKQSSSKPENHLLNLEFTIDPASFPADFPEAEPVKLYWNRNTVNKDTARERYQLRQLGEKMKVMIGRKLDANDFVGKQVNLKIKNGSWQGIPRAEIEAIEPM